MIGCLFLCRNIEPYFLLFLCRQSDLLGGDVWSRRLKSTKIRLKLVVCSVRSASRSWSFKPVMRLLYL